MNDMTNKLRKIETRRVPHVARYQDLDALVHRFFSDGQITDTELNILGRLDNILTTEFRVAQEHFVTMDKSSPLYAKAQDLINYLYRCRNLIDAAHDKAKVYNALSEQEKKRFTERPIKSEPDVLNLTHIGTAGVALVKGLLTPMQRAAAQDSFDKRQIQPITPTERQQIEMRLDKALMAMNDKTPDSTRLNRLLGLRERIGLESRGR